MILLKVFAFYESLILKFNFVLTVAIVLILAVPQQGYGNASVSGNAKTSQS
jgi:hypothetical protein